MFPLPGVEDVLNSSKPIPLEPWLERDRDTLTNPDEERESFDWNPGQQQYQHSGYQPTEARLGDSVLMSYLGADAPHINDALTPQVPASESLLWVSEDDEESIYRYETTSRLPNPHITKYTNADNILKAPPEYRNPSPIVPKCPPPPPGLKA